MFKLAAALGGLCASLLPLLEITFLALFLGLTFSSIAWGAIIFCILLITAYFLGVWSRALAWTIFGYSLFYFDLDAGFIKAILVALLLGIGRVATKKIIGL